MLENFSGLIVTSPARVDLRIVLLYRPTYLDQQQISMNAFFGDEFSSYLESLLLAKEKLLIIGDVNILVDVRLQTTLIRGDWCNHWTLFLTLRADMRHEFHTRRRRSCRYVVMH